MTQEQVLDNELTIAHCTVQFDGSNISTDFMDDVISVEVEQNLYLPAMFTIRAYSSNLKWFDSTLFKIGTIVKISMGHDKNNMTAVLEDAEITAIELDGAPLDMPTVTLRGYSKLHRLHRERKTRTFLDVSDSDLLSTVAGEAGLTGSADSTNPVFKYVLQNNQTSFEFLQQRALRSGMELYTEGATLKLRKPVPTGTKVATVEWGEDLTHFNCRVSGQGQIDSVTVRGWDPATKQAIVGESSSSDHKPSIGTGSDGGAAAKKAFGGAAKMYTLYHSVADQTEAQNIAEAIQKDINSRYVQIEAEAMGNATIAAGKIVEVKGLGTNYSGTYYATAVTHRYSSRGFYTWFEANGRQSNTFMELLGQRVDQGNVGGRIYGPVIGMVSNNKDDGGMNRVKVKLPVLGDDLESNWARVVTPMTGNAYGAQYLPELNDEVLVMFENGDPNYPYVIGGLWNGKDAPVKDNSAIVGEDGKVKQRIFKTRSGHIVTFDDSDDAPKIEIIDKTGNNKIVITSSDNLILVHSDKDIHMEAPNGEIKLSAQNITMTADQNIKATATQNVELTATQDLKGTATGNVKLDATQNVEITSTMDTKINATMNFKAAAQMNAEINGTIAAKLAGLAASVEGQAEAKLQGAAMAQIQGGLVKIN